MINMKRELLRIHSLFVENDYSDYFEEKIVFENDIPVLKLNTQNNSLMIEIRVDSGKIYCLAGSYYTEKSLTKLNLPDFNVILAISIKLICNFNVHRTWVRDKFGVLFSTDYRLDFCEGKFKLYEYNINDLNLICTKDYIEDCLKFIE